MTTKARWWNRKPVITVQNILDSAAGLGFGKWPDNPDSQLDMVAKLAPQLKQIIAEGKGKFLRLHSKAWEALK